MKKMRLFICSLFFSLNFVAKAQNLENKEAILGQWKFVRMEYTGELAAISKTEQDRINKMNDGNTISFYKNGTYKTVKKSKEKETPLANGKYQVLNNGKILSLDGMKTEVYFHDGGIIKLFSPNRPIMVWRKINNQSSN